jgi:hypothetical protein
MLRSRDRLRSGFSVVSLVTLALALCTLAPSYAAPFEDVRLKN